MPDDSRPPSPRTHRPVTTLAMQPGLPARFLGDEAWRNLAAVAEVPSAEPLAEFESDAARAVLARTEVLLTGWGCPRVDEAVLAAAPKLGAIVHTAGSVKGHVDPACWRRGIVVSTAAGANALPVAEYALAMILLAGKRTWEIAAAYRARRAGFDLPTEYPEIGNYARTVGIVGASRIGRRVIELLRPFDLRVVVSDPYLSGDAAAALGVAAVDLDELVAGCEVVSLHAPSTPATRHMIDRRRLAAMPDGATLINTARGALVDHEALTEELVSGRLSAVLDVTEPEPLPAGSPLYDLPNVVLTPHLAGAIGRELWRLGASAVAEVARYAAGEPLAYPVRLEDLDRIA